MSDPAELEIEYLPANTVPGRRSPPQATICSASHTAFGRSTATKQDAEDIQSFTVDTLLNGITLEPDKRGGKPCIRGLRITVDDVLEYLAGGMSHEALLRDFPDLEPDDIRAVLQFAAERERRLSARPA